LAEEEFQGLEANILENGYDPAFPIITWNGTIIDGHNRYNICISNGIEFKTAEKEFPSRSAVIMWIVDNQIQRRNINKRTRKFLIGIRYTEEKKTVGENQYTSNSLNRVGSNFPPSTAKKIGDQTGMSDRGVKDAEKFSQAVLAIVANTGISRAAILTEKINGTQDDILDLAALEKDLQVKVISKVIDRGLDIESATKAVITEDRERKAAEEKRKQLAKNRQVGGVLRNLEEMLGYAKTKSFHVHTCF